MTILTEKALLCEALEEPTDSVTQVSREPLGQGAVSGFDVMSQPDESAPLRYYVDTSRLAVAEETGFAMGEPGRPDARIWLHPADPHLPALPAVAFHHAADSLLNRIGFESRGVPEFVGYRPGRRAVVKLAAENAAGPGVIWLKIVRPSRVARIARTHEACAEAGLPVPQLYAWSPQGVMLLANATGTPAAETDLNAQPLLDHVDALRQDITGVQTQEVTKGVAGRLEWYADRLTERERVRRVRSRAHAILAEESGERPQAVVHGDLHFGQLFLAEDGAISGLIDVDTLGHGDPAEDPAAFMAHATASAMLTGAEAADRVWALADEAMARWGKDQMVRAFFAVHALGHALGAEDRADPAQAERLLASAEAVLGGALPSTARE